MVSIASRVQRLGDHFIIPTMSNQFNTTLMSQPIQRDEKRAPTMLRQCRRDIGKHLDRSLTAESKDGFVDEWFGIRKRFSRIHSHVLPPVQCE